MAATIKWLLAVLFVCFFACVVMAQSEPPAPGPAKPAHENQQTAAPSETKAEPKQKATVPDSSRVDQRRSMLAAERPKDAGNNRNDNPPRDWWPIVASILNLCFTAFLTRLMYLQWRAMQKQAKHMEDGLVQTADSVKAAQTSADAAKASAAGTVESNKIARDSFVLGTRAWLIPEVEDASPFETETGWKVAFYIANTGSVPGVMINAHARVDTDPDFGTAPPQMFSPRGAIVLPGSGKEGALRVTAAVPSEIFGEQLLAPAGSRLCVYCAVTYKDVISDELGTGERETRVSWIRGQDGLWYNNPYFEITLK